MYTYGSLSFFFFIASTDFTHALCTVGTLRKFRIQTKLATSMQVNPVWQAIASIYPHSQLI